MPRINKFNTTTDRKKTDERKQTAVTNGVNNEDKQYQNKGNPLQLAKTKPKIDEYYCKLFGPITISFNSNAKFT